MTIDINGMLENLLCEGNIPRLFEQIVRRGAHIVHSLEVSKSEFEQMSIVREALIKESEDAHEKVNKDQERLLSLQDEFGGQIKDYAQEYFDKNDRSITVEDVVSYTANHFNITSDEDKDDLNFYLYRRLNARKPEPQLKKVPAKEACPDCQGLGGLPPDYCPTCEGSGEKNNADN